MEPSTERVVIAGKSYQLVEVVGHANGETAIVLCCSAEGELRYVSTGEWEAAATLTGTFSDGSTIGTRNVTSGAAPVTRDSPWPEKVALIMSLFRGRMDVYAEGYVGKNTKPGKLSYWPHCSLRWVRGVCPRLTNPRFRCSDCDHPKYVPLTEEVVLAHCKGKRDERRRIKAMGIYVVDGDVCYLLAADFDGEGWQEAAAAFRDACRRHGLFPAVERSRSGAGAHVWVFFDGPVKASLARRVGEGLVSEARNACTAVSFRSFDRLFPLQDVVGPGNLGSLIALPLQGEAVRGGNSVFVDDDFEQLPDQCAYLSTVRKVASSLIAALADKFGRDPVGLPDASSGRMTIRRKGVDELDLDDAATYDEMTAGLSTVRVTLSDGVRIRREGLPPRLINQLRNLAAFRNPEYTKRLRMHLSVWETPRIVDLSMLDGDDLVLPRGCTDGALAMIREMGAEPVVTDLRTGGRQIHVRFRGELRPLQTPCRDSLTPHDLGVLVAPTGFGKSVIAASVIAAHQTSTLVIVPNTTLLLQWRESLRQFLEIDDEPPVLLTPTGRRRKHQPGTVGIIGDGKHLRSGIVDVALATSLFEKGEVASDGAVSPFVGEYGMVIVDEAQHVAASKVLEVMASVRARYVYAMTATPKRKDGLDRILFLECGPLRHEVAVADQVAEQGMRRLLVPRFTTSRPNPKDALTWHALMDYICADEERNRLIVADALRMLEHGRTPLVLTRRIEHARLLADAIEVGRGTLDAQVTLLVGSDPEPMRRLRLEEIRTVAPGQPLCVVATGSYVGEGFDLDRLDTLLLAGPVAFEGALAQWVGRLHRTLEGKAFAVVLDYVDAAVPMFDNEWRGRLRAYKRLGYEMANEADLVLVGLEGRDSPPAYLLSGQEYAKAFDTDLSECMTSLVVASSWARLKRVRALEGALRDAVKREVSIRVILKEPNNPDEEWRLVIDRLRTIGCEETITSEAVPLDYAVFDGALVWYGSVAPFAFPRRDDCSLRFTSREVASELIGTTSLN